MKLQISVISLLAPGMLAIVIPPPPFVVNQTLSIAAPALPTPPGLPTAPGLVAPTPRPIQIDPIPRPIFPLNLTDTIDEPLPEPIPDFGPQILPFPGPEAHECPENEVWTDCGSACKPRCFQRPPQFCTLQCVIGCQCKPGYLLNAAGKCVAPLSCLRDLFPTRNP